MERGKQKMKEKGTTTRVRMVDEGGAGLMHIGFSRLGI